MTLSDCIVLRLEIIALAGRDDYRSLHGIELEMTWAKAAQLSLPRCAEGGKQCS
jgi:hypothetical protein